MSAVYALHLYREVIFGEVTNEKLIGIPDMNMREIIIMAPLVIMTILLGVYPSLITDITGASVDALLADVTQKLSATVGQ